MNRRAVGLAAVAAAAAALWFFMRSGDRPPEPKPGQWQTATELPPALAPDAQPKGTAVDVPVAPASEAEPTAPEGEIEGRAVDAQTRAGIAGAELTWSSDLGAHSARSGADGRFTFRPPRAGAYQLASAKADGYLPFGPEWGKSPISVVFRAKQRVRGVVVALTPSPELVAYVVDANGALAPGASVRVLVPRVDETALFPMRERFVTDARGQVRFRAEPYSTVEAWHATLGSGSEQLDPGAKELTVTLTPFAADAGARVSLSGRVVSQGRGVAGALVHAGSALRVYPKVYGAMDGYRELTDDEGRFELTDLQPGMYDVSAHQLGLAPAHRFDVTAPGKNVVLELGQGPRLSGRVTDERGAPVPSFTVTLEWRKAPLERLTVVEASFVDPEGRYAIEGVAPGDYVLEVASVGFSPASQPVSVQPPAATADVKLERGVRVMGVVRSEGARAPIAQARVELEHQGDVPPVMTDAAGVFALDGLPRGGFSLHVTAAGYNGRILTVVDAAAAIEVELTAVEPDAGAKVELVGIGAVLRGRGDALVIGQVISGGGAQAAGIVAGDELVAVDGRAVTELGFEAAIRAIRGPVASPVELSVRRQGKPPPVQITVTRKKITN